MSIIYCVSCRKFIDTDHSPFFIHNGEDTYCERCALENNFEDDIDGEYYG